MKRCPKCDFLYLDTDERCDLDGAVLVTAVANLETVVGQGESTPVHQSWKWVVFLTIAGLTVGIILAVAYTRINRSPKQGVNEIPMQALQQTTPSPEPSAVVTQTTTATPETSVVPKPDSTPQATKRGALSSNPVSTTTNAGVKRGVIIRLSNGRTIEADEAWHTKDGVWYRRAGMVTLLKAQQVKAIEKTP